MRYYKFILVLVLGLSLFACREEDPLVLSPDNRTDFSSWSEVFESYWDGMNYSYVFWDVDPIDWDEVYREYKPRFEGLEFNNAEDSATVKGLFEEIAGGLLDHHYCLTLYDANGDEWFMVSPGRLEIEKRDYYHEPFAEKDLAYTVQCNKEKGRVTRYSHFLEEKDSMEVYSYCIDNQIAYLRISDFDISSYIQDEKMLQTLQNYFDMINDLENLRGIIIDTRNNKGGRMSDMNYVFRPFLEEELSVYYTRAKIGMGRLDYSPWHPVTFYPIQDDENIITRELGNVPIVSVIDLYSVSMGESIALSIKELPNGYVVGERSLGAFGPLIEDFNMYYTGTFKNSAFEVYTSTLMLKGMDGQICEGIGIIPDVEALYNEAEFKKGNDTQLEAAVQLINSLVR